MLTKLRFCTLPAFLLLLFGFGSACGGQPPAQEVQIKQQALTPESACSGRFVAHQLPHETAASVARVGFFISNGAGMAINDLDNDGDMDIVLGNIFGPNHIFWNEGGLRFTPEQLFDGSVRAVTAVDVNGDEWLDLVFAVRGGNVAYWQNQGAAHTGQSGRFAPVRLDGVDGYAYALDWADVDADGDLDLISGSYDASMEKIHGQTFNKSQRSGVYLYENEDGQFSGRKLADEAQALTLQFVDLNEDDRLDIQVGNDFDVPDYVWLNEGDSWTPDQPFATTTMSTMSFDVADINNDGRWEQFAADMHPYSEDPAIMTQWQPVMDMMEHDMSPDDPQQMANVLQVRDETGQLQNTAESSGLTASGWSWSSKFGDLDQDGWQDLYVVNGMQALDNFKHLPNDELIEENQAFRNAGHGLFDPMPDWGLNSTRGGRSMSQADLDGDGDLDIVINNLQAPAQIFENQLCSGRSLLVDLFRPDVANSRALGAIVTLRTSDGEQMRRVRASSGYLSGDPARVHFGIADDAELIALEIRWPDGEQTTVTELNSGYLVQVTR